MIRPYPAAQGMDGTILAPATAFAGHLAEKTQEQYMGHLAGAWVIHMANVNLLAKVATRMFVLSGG
jgi:hypothetical protein